MQKYGFSMTDKGTTAVPSDVGGFYLASEVDALLASHIVATDQSNLEALHAELDTMNLAVGYFHEENDRFITRIAELEKALDDCRLLAMREARGDPRSHWSHIIRFCTEAGRGPSPLRADS